MIEKYFIKINSKIINRFLFNTHRGRGKDFVPEFSALSA
jgi:hypothetical protein